VLREIDFLLKNVLIDSNASPLLIYSTASALRRLVTQKAPHLLWFNHS